MHPEDAPPGGWRAAWPATGVLVAVLVPLDLGLSGPWTVATPTRLALAVVLGTAVGAIGALGAHRGSLVVFTVVAGQVLAVAPTVGFGHFVAMVAASYASGRQPDRRRSAIGLVALIGVTVAIGVTAGDEDFEYIFPLFMFSTAWALGGAVRGQARRADLIAAMATRIDRQQAELAHLAVLEERAHIAREIHDVLAHSLTSIVVQAEAADELVDHDPVGARHVVQHIESTARSGLSDVRTLLSGVDTAASGGAPLPGIADLPALVDQMGRSGLPVDLDLTGAAADGLPPGVGLSAYRIVQESLTNVLRHAGPVATRVAVCQQDRQVEVVVTNAAGTAPTNGQGSGRGLRGMRERAAMHGGVLEAGPSPEGGYCVRALLRSAGR